jgi:hypothetical protein
MFGFFAGANCNGLTEWNLFGANDSGQILGESGNVFIGDVAVMAAINDPFETLIGTIRLDAMASTEMPNKAHDAHGEALITVGERISLGRLAKVVGRQARGQL